MVEAIEFGGAMRNLLLVVLGAIALSGCAPSETTFNAFVAEIRTKPSVRKLYLDECIRTARQRSFENLQEWATYLGIGVEKVPRRMCSRYLEMAASGRMTYAQYAEAFNPNSRNLAMAAYFKKRK